MAQNIFIDFDGTICFERFWRTAPLSWRQEIENLLFCGKNDKVLKKWMRGALTFEEVCEFAAHSLNINFEDVFSVFVSDCQTMSIHTDILEAIKNCRKNNKVYLVTDNMDSFTKYTEPQLNLRQYFDKIYNSADFGILKSDKEFSLLAKAVSDTKSDITESVLLDNSPNNCEIFKKLGGNSFCVKDKQDVISILKMLE